mmetsp:Transcript_29967/g.61847  ORF Transcript_29967/g.61847 Transcript_29967/m.61847 type:complete len:382 (-) Transcript_29967:52-1197(-)
MSDSFDLWGASLCWGYEDLPAAPRLEKQGAAEEKASSPPAAERGVRDSLQDRPQGNILSTQDIDDHEASFDCGAQEAFHVQDSAVSSTVRSATKRASSEGAISLTSPARASEQSGAVEKAPSPFREARRSLACDDTQIYVLPPSSGAGDEEAGVQTLVYMSPAVALEALSPPAQNVDTLQYEMREEAPEQPSAAEQIRACADTLEYFAPSPPKKLAFKRAQFSETLPYGFPDEPFEPSPPKAPPVATPVRRRRGEAAAALSSSTGAPEACRAGSRITGPPSLPKRRKAPSPDVEESQWLVPVKRRKATEATQVSSGPVRPGKKEPSISRPAPAGTSTWGARRLAFRSGVTGKQLTLCESLKRTSSTPRSCVSIDADEAAGV